MCQWMKSYFDKNYNGEPYDALARRKNQDLTLILGGGKIAAPPKKSSASAGVSQPKPTTTSTYQPPSTGGMGSGVPKAAPTGAPRVVASGAGAAANKQLEAKCTGLEG